MKALFLTLIACFTMTLFASETTLFRDEDTGFVMEIPSDMNRTWNLSNSENGIEMNVFQSEDFDEKFYVIVTGRFPLKDVIGEGSEGLYPFIVEQLESAFLINQENDEDSPVKIEMLPSLADEEYCGQRFRFHVWDEDWDEPFQIDVHAFMIETYSFVVATGMYPSKSEELDAFTTKVLSGVRFIEEDK